MRRELQPLRLPSSTISAMCGIDLARRRRRRWLIATSERTSMELPTYLQIEPVGQCNLRCQMCPIQFRRDGPPHGPLGLHGLRQVHPADRPVHRTAGTASARAGRADDAPPVLRHGGLRRGERDPRHHQLEPDPAQRAPRAERASPAVSIALHVSIDGATAETYERIRVRVPPRQGRAQPGAAARRPRAVRARLAAGTHGRWC